MFNKKIRSILSKKIQLFKFLSYKNIAYSQEGEDLILKRIYDSKTEGFYIDIGAHHPIRFSNTYLFYKMGWRGINVDAMPGSMITFNKIRPRDINIETPISLNSSEIDFYIFNDPALNGFSKELSIKRNTESDIFKIKEVVKLKTYRLDEILDKYLPKNQNIDFMTVDVEGLDLDVLKSNNWEKYRPCYVLVEILSDNLEKINEDLVYQFMHSKEYSLYAKSVNTCFFKRAN